MTYPTLSAATWLLWAKRTSNEAPGSVPYHPLIYHLIDVAAVADALWPLALAPALRLRLMQGLGLADQARARTWVAFLAGLHDIGKAAPHFAWQWKEHRPQLKQAGFAAPLADRGPLHGAVTAAVLRKLLRDQGLAPRTADALARLIGGHHGSPVQAADIRQAQDGGLGSPRWEQARKELVDGLAVACDLPAEEVPRGDLDAEPGLLMILAGLVSVADWIGSDERYFPYGDAGADLQIYAAHARAQAEKALAEQGWHGWTTDPSPRAFGEIFPFDPNELQRGVIDLAAALPAPALVLIEAPMGIGKSEAAMYLAHEWAAARGAQGCYFALPTQATSNQMFCRVKAFLARRYPAEMVGLQLLHGHAALSAEFEALRRHSAPSLQPTGIASDEGTDGMANVIAAEWFSRRKRGLLAPYGVGTIDQALLAALQTRHYFVRLLGLAGKVVIIDEVHAYDAYMSQLLQRLLTWLACLGSSVVLLSATLPARSRAQMVGAFGSGLGQTEPAMAPAQPYPRLTWSTNGGCGARSIGALTERRIALQWFTDEAAGVSDEWPPGTALQAALRDGGCAAVICNTVGEAQRIYRALQRYFNSAELDLFHARFLFAERAVREQRTLRRFGKMGAEADCGAEGLLPVQRPQRFVLVATQVIEQSLDLDFDLLLSALAPVDLLLQRAGRLHRHAGVKRPNHLAASPQLWLLAPPLAPDGLPRFQRGHTYVYDRHILLRSWLALRGRTALSLPSEIEPLIEEVYDDRPCPAHAESVLQQEWERTWHQLQTKLSKQRHEAAGRLIGHPSCATELLAQHNDELEEDNLQAHPALQALTRLSGPTVQLICLFRSPAGPAFAPDGAGAIDERAIPDRPQALALLARSVTLSHQGVVETMSAEPIPAGWRRAALLRHHHLLLLEADATAVVAGWQIRIDPALGVVIHRLTEEEG